MKLDALSSKKAILSTIVTALIIINGVVIFASGNQQESTTSFVIPEMQTSFDYEITAVFLGINETRVNATEIEDRLPTWYAPFDGMF
jgi:hypothetical protein